MDFIGFTYNGKHSWNDLGIYRTSDGSRYNANLTAAMTDKTAEVAGSDGQYYFGTTFKNKTFTINYAFDGLTEEKFQQLKTVFDGDGIHDLIFDENPDRVWSAKVTGTASIKYLCFDDNDIDDDYQRIYKGEGSITFTCYFPYARSIEWYGGTSKEEIEPIGGTEPIPFELNADFTSSIDLSENSNVSSLTVNSNAISFNPPIAIKRGDIITWDSKTGLVKKNGVVCPCNGKSLQTLAPNDVVELSTEGNNLGSYYNLSIKYRYLYK
jgi:predicted phage tail component-like protein